MVDNSDRCGHPVNESFSRLTGFFWVAGKNQEHLQHQADPEKANLKRLDSIVTTVWFHVYCLYVFKCELPSAGVELW